MFEHLDRKYAVEWRNVSKLARIELVHIGRHDLDIRDLERGGPLENEGTLRA